MTISTFRKAIVAGLVAFIAAVGVALSDGDLTIAEALVSLGAGLTASAATYKVPNEDPAPTETSDPDEPAEPSESDEPVYVDLPGEHRAEG